MSEQQAKEMLDLLRQIALDVAAIRRLQEDIARNGLPPMRVT